MAGKLRTISFKRTGDDILEVKLSDSNYNPYHKDKARINDRKDMLRLMIDLKQKGVNFPEGWLD